LPKIFYFRKLKKTEDGRPKSGNTMDVKFKFENLVIWQRAMDYGEMIYTLSMQFPKDELYNLTSQIRRAADSISLNISEGSIGQSDPEQKRFMGIAIRSLAEVVTCLHKALRRKYISQTEFNESYEYAFNLMNMMIAFKNKIK
jgi:four helix bundle protein